MELIRMKLDNEELLALRARNEERLRIAKEAMGKKWLLHPDNSPKKSDQRTEFFLKKHDHNL